VFKGIESDILGDWRSIIQMMFWRASTWWRRACTAAFGWTRKNGPNVFFARWPIPSMVINQISFRFLNSSIAHRFEKLHQNRF
jgi:hypothetical protein